MWLINSIPATLSHCSLSSTSLCLQYHLRFCVSTEHWHSLLTVAHIFRVWVVSVYEKNCNNVYTQRKIALNCKKMWEKIYWLRVAHDILFRFIEQKLFKLDILWNSCIRAGLHFCIALRYHFNSWMCVVFSSFS